MCTKSDVTSGLSSSSPIHSKAFFLVKELYNKRDHRDVILGSNLYKDGCEKAARDGYSSMIYDDFEQDGSALTIEGIGSISVETNRRHRQR